MSLSIKKISALKEAQEPETEQAGKVNFRAKKKNNLERTPEEDTFEGSGKKKKRGKIIGWSLATVAVIIGVLLYKKGKALETAGKKLGEEVAEVAETAERKIVGSVADGAEDVAEKAGKKLGEEVSDVAGTAGKKLEKEVSEVSASAEQKVGEEVAEITPAAEQKVGEEVAEITPAAEQKVGEEVAEITPAAEQKVGEEVAEITPAAEQKVGEEVAEITPAVEEQKVGEEVAEITPAAEQKVGEEVAEITPAAEQKVGEEVAEITPAVEEQVGEEIVDLAPAAEEQVSEEVAETVTAAGQEVAAEAGKKERPIKAFFKKIFGPKTEKTKKSKKTAKRALTEAEKLVEKKKAEINAMLDRTIPEIPKEIKTIKIEHQNVTEHLKALTGMSMEEIERIPISEYKEHGLSSMEYVKELPGGRKLGIVRHVDKNTIDYMFIDSPQGEKEVWMHIYKYDSSMCIEDVVKNIDHNYQGDGKIGKITIKKPITGTYEYNSRGKLVEIKEIPDPETHIRKTIYFSRESGEIDEIFYSVSEPEYQWLKYDTIKDGKVVDEIFNDEVLK